MLQSLHIENIAVIKKADIDFSSGFTALTGETGAGKSIIIDGISLLLGAKADRELVRTGEDSAMVSGFFTNLTDESRKSLEDAGVYPDEDGNILIQRSVFSDGRSQIKVNGRSVTLSVLRSVMPSLVAIHGQSDTTAITDSQKQLELIDIYAINAPLLAEYSQKYAALTEIRRRKEEVAKLQNERERLVEILQYQIKDIDSLSLHDGEEEELIDKKIKIKNSEKISKNAGFVFKALKGSEKGSISFLLDRSISALEQISDVVPVFAEYAETLRDMLYRVEDIGEEVYAVISDMESDPTEALNKIESRLDKISKLKRKYGLTVADVLAFRDKARAELDTLENSDELLKKLEKQEAAAYTEALSVAEALHTRREQAAKEIEATVKGTLEFLDMPKVVFFASMTSDYESGRRVLYPTGYDRLDFYISANKGADAQPLSRIASGGELARIMLALKSAISDKDGIATVIYDEIDAGVSGKTARKIGIKMLELSASAQLLCVTHSAQIASLADTHLLIKKQEINSKTETSVTLLDRTGRISELSRILGGIDVTESQRKAAEDMLNERELYIKK
ncbi:MAG: DNA repair protein RecN [Clostridia bacterium]|nr:DNA repair protein RecN [Clostridia bacterium]